MAGEDGFEERLAGLTRTLGQERRTLGLGRFRILLDGLDEALASGLEARFGGFFSSEVSAAPTATVRFLDAGTDPFLELREPGEGYRIEAFGPQAARVVASYHFAVAEPSPATYRVALVRGDAEPVARTADNVLRFVTARLAASSGGLAVHGAGLVLDGDAFLFLGPSGSGKSTAMSLVAGATSLGDDFALILPGGDGLVAPAQPFDNSETVESRPTSGEFPLRGILRLSHADRTRVETPSTLAAVSSLLGCAAFPWALPDEGDALLRFASRVAGSGRYRHLPFALDTDLTPILRGLG